MVIKIRFFLGLFIAVLFWGCTENKEFADSASANETHTSTPVEKEIIVEVPPGFTTYKDLMGGFGLAYPQNWEKDDSHQEIKILVKAPQEGAVDQFQENVNVIVQSLDGTPISNLEQFKETTIAQLIAAIPDFIIIEEKKFDWKGNQALEILFSGTQNGFTLMWRQQITIRSQQAYVVTYTAETSSFAKYAGIVQLIFDSITFSN